MREAWLYGILRLLVKRELPSDEADIAPASQPPVNSKQIL